ncbi:hypothetical protein EVAR_866_1 [Eumeta japonica]|uniref:Uncharacterized protein n=1 Tax=Eumeta variegata TaxID=151549 RepID=A0A4C1SDS5_EUMVA|nr:hypothetical protein EVAR_866_1 [Eumeta japonica]
MRVRRRADDSTAITSASDGRVEISPDLEPSDLTRRGSRAVDVRDRWLNVLFERRREWSKSTVQKFIGQFILDQESIRVPFVSDSNTALGHDRSYCNTNGVGPNELVFVQFVRQIEIEWGLNVGLCHAPCRKSFVKQLPLTDTFYADVVALLSTTGNRFKVSRLDIDVRDCHM